MAFSNYGELKTAVQSHANRGDSLAVDKIPDFIRLGEERIGRKVRASSMVTVATLVIPGGTNYVALPDDFLAFKRVVSAAETRIEYMAPDALADMPTPGDASRYTIEGRRLIVGETPAADLTLTTRYYARPAHLSADTDTNTLLAEAPSLYLYSALIEFHIWAKNSQQVDLYGGLFDKAIAEVNSTSDAASISGSRLRVTGSIMRARR